MKEEESEFEESQLARMNLTADIKEFQKLQLVKVKTTKEKDELEDSELANIKITKEKNEFHESQLASMKTSPEKGRFQESQLARKTFKKEKDESRETKLARCLKNLSCRTFVRLQRLPEFSCQFCQATFFAKNCLERHLLENHSKKLSYACNYCDSKFSNLSLYEGHLMTHYNFLVGASVEDIPSTISNKENVHYKLDSQLRVVSSNITFSQNSCESINKNAAQLKIPAHKSGPVSRPKTAKKCSFCHKRFFKLGILKKHLNSSHLEKKFHKCPLCDKLFFSSYHRNEHVKHTHKRKNVKCHLCNHYSYNQHFLKKHIRSIHGKGENLIKEKCINLCSELKSDKNQRSNDDQRQANLRYSRRRHRTIRTKSLKYSIHNLPGEPPYCFFELKGKNVPKKTRKTRCTKLNSKSSKKKNSCKRCSQKFIKMNHLYYHLLIHCNLRYTCHLCNIEYLHPERLTRHFERRHAKARWDGKKSYKCGYCHEYFCLTQDLIMHALENHVSENDSLKIECLKYFSELYSKKCLQVESRICS